MTLKIQLIVLSSLTLVMGSHSLSAMESGTKTISSDLSSSSEDDNSEDTFDNAPELANPEGTSTTMKAEGTSKEMIESDTSFPREIVVVGALAIAGLSISALVSYLKNWRNERKQAWEEAEARRVQVLEEEQEVDSDTYEFSEDPQLTQRALDQYELGRLCFEAKIPDYEGAKKHFIRAAHQTDSRIACMEASYILGIEIFFFCEKNLPEAYTYLKKAERLVEPAKRTDIRFYLRHIIE